MLLSRSLQPNDGSTILSQLIQANLNRELNSMIYCPQKPEIKHNIPSRANVYLTEVYGFNNLLTK